MVLVPLLVGAAIFGGSKNESTMTNKTTTNVVNNFMQTMSTNIENDNSGELDMTQTLTFRAPHARMEGCSLRIEQNQKGTLRATMDAVANLSDEQKANLSADIANSQSQALEQANSGLSITPSENKSDVHNEITTNVENNLKTSIDKTFRNMNYASGTSTQDATIDLWGMQCEDSNILINQNQALEVVSENLAETISDSVQEVSAVTKAVNEQTQSVKQTNTGVGASGGGSISSACSLSVLIIGGIAAFPKIKEMMDKKKTPGTASSDGSNEGGGDGKINWGLIIGLTVGFIIILGIIIWLFDIYTPEFPCPDEDVCSKAWDEIKAKTPRVPADLLRKYHNCRIRHRVRDDNKPQYFRPRCESYCAYVTREEETPGYPSNALKSFFCFKGLSGDDDDDNDDIDNDDNDIDNGGTETQEPEYFSNNKKIPEGFGNYY